MSGLIEHKFSTPNGNAASFLCRSDTVDHIAVDALVNHDEYGFKGRHFTGWALDVGSHVGSAAVLLALDNPDLQVVAIEAVPENAELVVMNVAKNGVSDRVHVVPEAASKHDKTEYITYDYTNPIPGTAAEYVRDNRFIGGLWRQHADHGGKKVKVKAVSLKRILADFGIDEIAILKIDCEGCEWAFLSNPAANAHVVEIVGEWHDLQPPAIKSLLEATHDVSIVKDDGGIGLFRAVRREG